MPRRLMFWIWRVTGWMPKHRDEMDRAFEQMKEAAAANDEAAFERSINKAISVSNKARAKADPKELAKLDAEYQSELKRQRENGEETSET